MSSLTIKGARVVDPARAPTLAQNLGSEKRVIKGDARKFQARVRTKPVRDGVFRGGVWERPAVLWSQVCGGGGGRALLVFMNDLAREALVGS